ncbi:MAG: hypothetical protein QNJ90_03705 [Planctomycetota bacterium]|nr:hypothetical protein [Planctomycetota bacterium]
MRILSVISLSVCLAVCGACGGGGAEAVSVGAQVTGKITGVNGSNAVAGIVVESLVDGTTVVTGSDGAFQLAVRAGDPIVLRFEDPAAPAGEGPPKDPSESGDDTPDGADIDGDEVELDPLGEDEHCRIEVEIEDGEVVECRIEHPESDDDDRPVFEAECRLKPTEGSSEPEAIAEAELTCSATCCELEVEVEDVLFATELTVAVECEGLIEELGVIEIVAGEGHFELDSCTLEVLPFGAESLADLRGCALLLLDANGNAALSGCVPGEDEEDKRDRFEEDCDLEPVEGSSEPTAEGEAELFCQDGGCKLVVEVGGVVTATSFTVTVECGELREEIGTIEIVEGQGRFVREYGLEDVRPFEANSLTELGDCRLLLLDGEGAVALAGCFPGDDDDGEDEDGEEEGRGYVADCDLEPTVGGAQPEADGDAIVRCGAGGCSLVVEVEHLVGVETLTLVVLCEGVEAELGVIEIVEGEGRFAKEYGAESPRPFGVESLKALAGCELLVYDGETIVLRGCFPGGED